MLSLFQSNQCNNYMFLRSLLAAGIALSPVAGAADSHFANRAMIGSGAANVAPAVGGEYVYGPGAADSRPVTPALLIGAAPRNDYTFLTAAEEEALIKMHDGRRADQVRRVLIASRAKYAIKRPALQWPKVVLRNNEICVPELASSEALDWKDHLTCYQAKGEGNVNP